MSAATKRPTPAARSRRRSTAPIVIVAVLLVGAIVGLGVQYWRSFAAAAAERAALLSRVDTELAKPDPSGDELSQLVAQLQKLPDHETARDLRAARARIELARDRPERAQAIFGNEATGPGASPAEQGLGAAILLRMFEPGSGDAVAQKGMLLQALAAAGAAAADSRSAIDEGNAWLAAVRLGDDAAAAQHAAALREHHPDSAMARLVELQRTFDPKQDANRVEDLCGDFPRRPAELEAMRILVVLQSGELEKAVAATEALLARSAGVPSVRFAAALVFLACAMTHPEGSPARASWLERRDVQIEWLSTRLDPGDPRRAQAQALRTRR